MAGSCVRAEAGVYCMCDVEQQRYNEGDASNDGFDLPSFPSLRLCAGADARNADQLF